MTKEYPMIHGNFSMTREVKASRELAFRAWTENEHRKHWFAPPTQWDEKERSIDLREGGLDIMHGIHESGMESRYIARYHSIVTNTQLIYAFDMFVNGKHYSVSLASVQFEQIKTGTQLTYTEQIIALTEDYTAENRIEGTNQLLNNFKSYMNDLGS